MTARRPLALDAGLLARFRAAAAKIAWRPAPKGPRRPAGRRSRIAHLNDEEARVETWAKGSIAGIAVDSGPVGALAIVVEADRRGPPTALGASNAGRDPAFPMGAIVASWGSSVVPHDASPGWTDVVELARYALA